MERHVAISGILECTRIGCIESRDTFCKYSLAYLSADKRIGHAVKYFVHHRLIQNMNADKTYRSCILQSRYDRLEMETDMFVTERIIHIDSLSE